MKFQILVVLSLLSALLYRCGGMSKDNDARPKWIPQWLRQRWIRALGCSLLALIGMWLYAGFSFEFWWLYLLVLGGSFGMTTTYWDFLFGYDNFYMHGAMIGLMAIPMAWTNTSFIGILIRAISLAIFMGLWSKVWSIDWIEEFGRGFIIPLTTLLLVI